jgi:hypothetical protein
MLHMNVLVNGTGSAILLPFWKQNVETISWKKLQLFQDTMFAIFYWMRRIKNCEKFNFMEHVFNVEAHAEHTGWHWCYEVSEIGTFFEKKKKSVGYQAKKSWHETRSIYF